MKLWIQRYRTQLAVAGVLALAALGFLALDHLLNEVHLRDVRAAWHALSPRQLLLSILLAGVSYLALTLYDVLALIAIGRPLPYRTAAFASFTSYTLSHNLGLSLLTGGSARYRVYSAAGLGVGDVARVVTIASGTFWGGVITLAALMLAMAPKSISLFGMSPAGVQIIAVAILVLIVGFIVWLGRAGRHVRFKKLSLPLPRAPIAIAQIGVAAVDLAAASAALFVLVPGADASIWPLFFMGYTLAIIAVLVTHVPGGIGIFEAVMLAALPSTNRPELVAALLAYRLIYYIAPLVVAIALVAFQEGRRWHKPIARTVRGVHIVASGLSPTMIAALVFLGGLVLLVSGSLPAVPGRMLTLYRVLPLPFVEASHMAASLVGAALLLLSAGLYRRLDGAFWLTRTLLLAGAGFSLLKGLDFEEASVMLAITALLQWTRPAFYRRTHLTSEALTPGWLATVAVALGVSIWIGFFAYKHVDYQTDLWWRFAQRGDASRFLRASFAVAVMTAAVAYWQLFRPVAPEPEPVDASNQPTSQAIALAQHTNAQLAFTGDKRFLVSSTGQCFVMYQIRGHSWIVMGDPVGARAEWSDLLWRLRERADAAQGRLLLYQISAETLPLAVELGLQIVKYGEEARVDLATFTLNGPAAKPLRYAERRALRDGATFEVVAAADLPAILGTLSDISTHWLQAKGHREKGFSVGRFDNAYMSRFDCAVVRQGERIVAFANIWAAEDKSELSVDLMRHEEDMPYGTMDFLFVRLMQWGQANGYRCFNLGVAPLSGLEARRLAPLWSKLGSLLYRHGESLYGFEGLRAYKDKFSPEWVPCFVAGPQGISFGRALIDLQALISAKVPA
ncbi:MAG: bifunctional lysylphosphatidylglycerol flippase/synthetase MprF [Pseudomonadota bacterium]|jgi:phosphatidylglycerol lysyltransferase